MENRKRDDEKQKELYESPKATFIKLQLEERLLTCIKTLFTHEGGIGVCEDNVKLS